MALHHPDPHVPFSTDAIGRLHEKIGSLERRLRALETWSSGGSTQQVPAAAALPTAGRKGRVMFNTSDNKLYVDNGSSWVVIGTQT